MRRTINSALALMIAVIATVVSSVIVLAYASQPSIMLEGGPAAAGVTLLTVMDGSVLALPSDRQTLVGLDSTDHQTIDLGFIGAPTAVHFDYQRRIVAITDNTAHILEHSGREIRQFKVPTASGMALVGSDIVLAASTARSRIQVFSRQGHRLAEFGSPQQIEVADPRENQFLNEGLVFAGPANSFFFIFSRTPNPLIEQWTTTGQKVREFRPEGVALQRQSEAITNYLAWRATGDTGGLAAISAAAFDPGSGHLWLATTAERPEMPNVYEYDIAGTKLAEYSLHRDAGYLPFISQLLASQGRLFVLADSTAYVFALPATVRLADSISAKPAFRVASAIRSLLAVRPEAVVFAQFSCGAEDASFTCTRNCTAGPAVDCKSPSFWGNDPIVAHSCSTVDNQCSLTVTTCTSSTGNINHGPETTRCPTDDDQDGYEAMADCDDSAWNIHPGAPTNCQAGQDMDCDGRDDFDACHSPILVDLGGDGFRLTGADQGVRFDLDGDGKPEQLG